MRGLKDKVAIVTGGAGGIGSATVRRLIEEGCKVAIADINEKGAKDLAAELGSNAIAIHFDAISNDSVKAMVDQVASHFGRIDILDNNHALINAVVTPADTTILKTSFDIWDDVMAVNVRSYMAACKYTIPYMLKAGGGSIINFSSVSGFMADITLSAYAASKAAVVALTNSIAAQYGKQNIRCNTIAPCGIVTESARKHETKLMPILLKHQLVPRFGEPEDIASLVAFLASGESSFIQGQLIFCDGGLLRHMPFTADTEGLRG